MNKIKVHVLNFHSIFSHIELVLENTSTQPHTYYGVNRWEIPSNEWTIDGPNQNIQEVSSTYSFDIYADPDEITRKWNKYWFETQDDASIVGKNCAVAAQWFLTEFANIPKPSLSNISWNHLAFGIIWPSFIPCPVTLPGRIMSNTKFYIEARNNPTLSNQYTRLFLYANMALATLMVTASVFALAMAATILSTGIAELAITGCAAVGIVSTYAFFKAHNMLSTKNISEEFRNKNELIPIS